MLGWALAGGATLWAAPFSHQLHLKLKPDCVACHAAAPASAQAADNLLPDRSVCLPCHRDPALPDRPQRTGVAKFNHQLHLTLGNVAPTIAAAIDGKTYLSPPGDIRPHLETSNPCEACHRGLRESNQVGPSALPRMADCLVCHSRIDYPVSCEKCHPAGANLKPATHTADFLDTHTSGKLKLDKASCAVCHGRRFTCLGSH
jgi:hypothetical protein